MIIFVVFFLSFNFTALWCHLMPVSSSTSVLLVFPSMLF